MYRKGSIQPFTKGLPSAQLLDILTDVLVDSDKAGSGVHVKDEASAILQTAVRKARECNEQGTLLRIPYITLFEYLQVRSYGCFDDCCKLVNVPPVVVLNSVASSLQYLKYISEKLRPCGKRAAFFLAAAVSDFFLPWSQMVGAVRPSWQCCTACLLVCSLLRKLYTGGTQDSVQRWAFEPQADNGNILA